MLSDETLAAFPLPSAANTDFGLLPPRERGILTVLARGSISRRELATILGVTPQVLRQIIRAAERRSAHPLCRSLALCWRGLCPADRRLAYLHHVLDMTVEQIVAYDLDAAHDQSADRMTRRWNVRTALRRVQRRAKRAEAQAQMPPAAVD